MHGSELVLHRVLGPKESTFGPMGPKSFAQKFQVSSDLKINGTAFHGLPCGVLLFDVSVSFKNHKIEAPDWLLKNSSHSEGGF